MMVALSTVTHENPFAFFPFLNNIWPEPYAHAARQATKSDYKSGQLFYIIHAGVVIGITGVWIDPNGAETDLYLRWTGLVPAYRGRGYATQALIQLIRICRGFCPSRTRLIELVPDNEYGDTVAKPFFEAFGFVHDPNVHVPADEETDWNCSQWVYDMSEEPL